MSSNFLTGAITTVSKRRLTEETCRKFGYQIGKTDDGKTVHIAPYYNEGGQLVAQKIRTQDKDFFVIGKLSEATLFGQRLWAAGGKRIVVCEGEIDAMSVSQAQQNKWATVSIPTGSKGAAKAIKSNLEYLESFSEIILMFDQDQPGLDAAAECVGLFSPASARWQRCH